MYILIGGISIMSIIFLLLYVQLKREVQTFYKQLRYMREENSQFKLYSTSSNHCMQGVIYEVNLLKDRKQEEKNNYLKSEKDIRDMIANISHDIRTPLTSIQGYVEMMLHCDGMEEKERYHQIVSTRLQDLETMLDEFFLYTKLMNSSNDTILEEKELYPLLCSTLLNYVDLLKEHQLEPMIICDDEALCAYIHEDSFKRLCMNLVMNVVRYGKAPFTIQIKRHKDKDMVDLCFSNQLIHHDVAVEHLFDRFYKADRTRNQKGSGLGLAIVKELVQRMQGDVYAEIENGCLQVHVILKNIL